MLQIDRASINVEAYRPLSSDLCPLTSVLLSFQQDQYPRNDTQNGHASHHHWRESHVKQRQEVGENQPQTK